MPDEPLNEAPEPEGDDQKAKTDLEVEVSEDDLEDVPDDADAA